LNLSPHELVQRVTRKQRLLPRRYLSVGGQVTYKSIRQSQYQSGRPFVVSILYKGLWWAVSES